MLEISPRYDVPEVDELDEMCQVVSAYDGFDPVLP
jgi:hypothetical protein